MVEPGSRLVEEQELGIGGERAGDLQETLPPIGQRRRRTLGLIGETDKPNKLARIALGLGLLLAGPTRARQCRDETGTRAHVPPDLDVLQDAEILEQLYQLKGAHQSPAGDSFGG